MQKIIIPILLLFTFWFNSNAQQTKFNQQAQLKSCNINIKANPFTAVTVLELEFYNATNAEIEAYQPFTLNDGQIITGFQLELNGKYREGSIEEKWKANNAYNSIVGKRIDPAIINQQYANNYTLNIYPVPAHDSRKVIITILQSMKDEVNKLTYHLPLNFKTITDNATLSIDVTGIDDSPQSNTGLIESNLFTYSSNKATINSSYTNITLNKPISFSILLQPGGYYSCINNTGSFLLRAMPDVEKEYIINAEKITVLWDISKSGKNRGIKNEINYLSNYLNVNKIKTVDFVLFNHLVFDKKTFTIYKNNFNDLFETIRNITYTGATSYADIDLSSYKTDAILFFSDGRQTIKSGLPKPASVAVSCVYSSIVADINILSAIVGNSGGNLIDLSNKKQDALIAEIKTAQNFLLSCKATTNLETNTTFPLSLGKSIYITGKLQQGNFVQLVYGNNSAITKTEDYLLNKLGSCNEETYNQVKLLEEYASLLKRGQYWNELLAFGIKNKIVTQQTSYIVLERIEDYFNYKIEPPQELKEKCAEMNYVYKSDYRIKTLTEFTTDEKLATAVNLYNQRIKNWSSTEDLIDLKKQIINTNVAIEPLQKEGDFTLKTKSGPSVNNNENKSLNEVVIVTSAYGGKRTARATSSNVQVISGEQLNAVRSASLNDALAGKFAGIQVRSLSSGLLGSTGSIRIRGEQNLGVGSSVMYVLNGTRINADDVNVDEIEDVTFLQGPSSAAIYGPDGANGAFILTSKKSKTYGQQLKWTTYKLADMEDEDYLHEIKEDDIYQKTTKLQMLEEAYGNSVSFYFDMAQYFYEIGYKQKAMELLMNGVELANGNIHNIYAAGYILEKWGAYDEAIKIYKSLISVDNKFYNIQTKRNLAFAFLGNKKYQAAFDILYDAITDMDNTYYYNYSAKEMAMADLNAIAVIYKDSIDISAINQNILKPLPVDLRITVECNNYAGQSIEINEPNGSTCSNQKPKSSLGIITGNNYYGYNIANEYISKTATKGKYRIYINTYNYYTSNTYSNWVRIIKYKNFQKQNQEIVVEIVNLDNQYGKVEIGEVEW